MFAKTWPKMRPTPSGAVLSLLKKNIPVYSSRLSGCNHDETAITLRLLCLKYTAVTMCMVLPVTNTQPDLFSTESNVILDPADVLKKSLPEGKRSYMVISSWN